MKWRNLSKGDLIKCLGRALVSSSKKSIQRNGIAYRGLAMVMALALIFTYSFATPISMAENGGTESYITAFDELGEDIAVQYLPFGASESEIIFPDSISGTVEIFKDVLIEETNTELEEEIEESEEESEDEDSEETDEFGSDDEEITDSEEADELEETTEESTEETEEKSQEEAVPEETPAESVPESTPDAESTEETPVLTAIVDALFPAMTVYAAEAEDVEEDTEEASDEEINTTPSYRIETVTTLTQATFTGVNWKLDSDRSTSAKFDSTIEGAKYVYVAEINTNSQINASLPYITVIVETKGLAGKFEQSVLVDGVLVTVTADPGVIPENAKLSVRKATEEETALAEEAVEAERQSNNVAASYTFDIKIMDTDDNEIQPDTSKGTVKVSFTLAEADNEELEADIYHITDANPEAPVAEKLETENRDLTVEAQTTGFSFYTVEFTYNNKQYVLPGNSIVPLREILEAVDIYGEVTEAYSSAPELFDAYIFRGEWAVEAKTSFDTEETLTVVADGKTYDIPVTDPPSNTSVQYDNTEKTAAQYVNAVLSDGVAATNPTKQGKVYTFSNGTDVFGIDSGIILDTSTSNHYNDPDLKKLYSYDYGGSTSLLEFEMESTGYLLNFNYAFASAEFNQQPVYNDSFGLFVSVNGSAYENIALITRNNGSKVPVSIVNLRAGLSGTEMENGQSTDLDRYTTHSLFGKTSGYLINGGSVNGISNLFNAQKEVKPGDKIKIKFVICDVTDSSVNSYVMIEGGSLSFDAPNSAVDYFEENLTSLDGSTAYEIICDEKTYVMTTTDTGTIPLSGTYEKESYTFIGKTLSIKKAVTGPNEEALSQEVKVAERPIAVDVTAPLAQTIDALKPVDVPKDTVVATSDTITITIDKSNKTMTSQEYCVVDSDGHESSWIKHNNGIVKFTGLDSDENYTIKARVPATKKAPKSLPSAGVGITTLDVITVAEPTDTTKPYIASPYEFVVTADPEESTILYSIDENTEYSSDIPSVRNAGKYTIYYKVKKEGYTTYYGDFEVTITKADRHDVIFEDEKKIHVKGGTIDLTEYVEIGDELYDLKVEGDIEELVDEITLVDGKLVITFNEEKAKVPGTIKIKIKGKNTKDYWIEIPVVTYKEVPVIYASPTNSKPDPEPSKPIDDILKLLEDDEKDEEVEDTPEETPTDEDDTNSDNLENILTEDELSDETTEELEEAIVVEVENLDELEAIPVKEKPVTLSMGAGSIIVTLENKDESVATAGLVDAGAVAKAILTEEQYAMVAAGSVLEIKVEVEPLENDKVSDFDKQVIEEGIEAAVAELPYLTMADYIDISMFMRIDNSEWGRITDTQPIDIVLEIPDQYKGLSDTYYIMRAHLGTHTLLYDNDQDIDTITISTGRFSTYALMYDDPQMMQVFDGGQIEAHCHMHWIIIAVAIIGVVGIYMLRKKNKSGRYIYMIDGTDLLIMLVLTVGGSCVLDYVALIIGAIGLVAMTQLTRRLARQ